MVGGSDASHYSFLQFRHRHWYARSHPSNSVSDQTASDALEDCGDVVDFLVTIDDINNLFERKLVSFIHNAGIDNGVAVILLAVIVVITSITHCVDDFAIVDSARSTETGYIVKYIPCILKVNSFRFNELHTNTSFHRLKIMITHRSQSFTFIIYN